MIGGYILPHDDFVRIFKEKILNSETRVRRMYEIIDNCIIAIKTKQVKKAYEDIEELETIMLKNPVTSVMVILDLNIFGNPIKQYHIKNEKDVLTNSGVISKTQVVKHELYKDYLSNILSNHFSNLVKIIEKEKVKNIKHFFKTYNFSSEDKKSKMGERAHDSHYLLKYIIYGDNPQWLGQVADAFLNHLGNIHRGFFNENTNPINLSPNKLKTVKDEEGENFYQLLIDSTNNTGQQTGGDLILLGVNNQVVANIQLKTSLEDAKSNGYTVSTSKLLEELEELKKLMNKNNIKEIDKFAEDFYNLFKTSGIQDEMTEQVAEVANKIAVSKVEEILQQRITQKTKI